LYVNTIYYIQLLIPINLRRRIFDFRSSSECKLSRLNKMVPLFAAVIQKERFTIENSHLISSFVSFLFFSASCHFHFFTFFPLRFVDWFFSSFIFSELQNSFVQDVSVWECFLPSSPFRWYLATVMPRCNSTYHFLSESLLFPIIRHCFNLI
jgi:hypothetical protein